ncbi:hypothetical protein IWZ03DRAFT_368817 [Phyllosticta citriasiana]|uniref:Uncharacterized protein n=1 Tax=Phyllosticta citriasiana TaxID=595635 RepID=A0ABR1KTP2_9PEZI
MLVNAMMVPQTKTMEPMESAGKGRDYKRARQIHDQLLPLTKAVYYHGGSHMEGTVPLKHVLVGCGILDHATVRSPLVPLRSECS